MHHDDWLESLAMLAERAQGLGVTADLCNLSIIELWGLYCFLKQLGETVQ